MDREGFRNRLKQYKKAREENPGLKYWEWKAQPAEKGIPKYDEGGEVIPTQEEYIAEQIVARKAAALEKSLSRTMPRVPQGIKTGERWNRVTKKVEDIYECGPSCAYTFSDNYGLNWMSSEDFKQNHTNYGWKQIPWEQRQPGNAVLIVDDSGIAKHTMMYDSDNVHGQPLFNHSNGGHDESAIRKKAKYPHHNPYLTYEFVGTPADSTQWINDYKKIYGFAEGGEVIGPPTESEWKRSLIKDDLWMHPDFYMAHSLEASKEALKQASAKLSGRDLMQEEELPIQRPVTGDFPYDWAIENLYDVENPYRKGIKNGVAKMYDNRTLGAGVDVKSGHPELYNRAKKYGLKLKEADDVAYEHIQHDADVIRNNYADIYGKAAADTLSLGPLFLLAQARYQLGNIKPAWDLAQKGLAEGNAEKITKATLSVTPKDHTHRINWVKNFKVYDNNPK